MSNSKTIILNKIKQALKQPVPVPFPAIEAEDNTPLWQPIDTDNLAINFAEQFTQLLGNFCYCSSKEELLKALFALLKEKKIESVFCPENIADIIPFIKAHHFDLSKPLSTADIAITGCEYLIARTGSILVSSQQAIGRTANVYAPLHICIASTNQLVEDIKDALEAMEKKYTKEGLPSLLSLITGPSRTADIEKTLVVGVHGPKEVFLFLVES